MANVLADLLEQALKKNFVITFKKDDTGAHEGCYLINACGIIEGETKYANFTINTFTPIDFQIEEFFIKVLKL